MAEYTFPTLATPILERYKVSLVGQRGYQGSAGSHEVFDIDLLRSMIVRVSFSQLIDSLR